MFEDTLLDLVHAVVALVEDLLGAIEIEIVLGIVAPGEGNHRIEVVLADSVLGGVGIEASEAFELLIESLLRGFAPYLLLGCLAILGDEGILGIVAELILDCASHLLEHILALLAVDSLPGLGLDVVAELEVLELPLDNLHELLGTVVDVGALEELELGIGLGVDIRRYEIYEEIIVVDIADGDGGLGGGGLHEAEDLSGLIANGGDEDLEPLLLLVRDFAFAGAAYCGLDERLALGLFEEIDTLDAVDDDGERIVWHIDNLDYSRRDTDRVEGVEFGILNGIVELGGCDKQRVLTRHEIDDGAGARPADGNGEDGIGEEDSIAQRHDRQFLRDGCLLAVAADDDGIAPDDMVIVERLLVGGFIFLVFRVVAHLMLLSGMRWVVS